MSKRKYVAGDQDFSQRFFSSKIYDSVHGFIHLNQIEKELVDSVAFQRLQAIHQLGVTYLVYPGATHSRFEHSLGVMELSTQIFDRLVAKEGVFAAQIEGGKIDYRYWRQIVRLAALCHDLGHLPFSHAAEKVLLGQKGHEKWTLAIVKSPFLSPIWEKLKREFGERDIAEDIIKISLGEEKTRELTETSSASLDYSPIYSPWEQVLCQIISGDFFGADRIDYLLRDAHYTGVSYGLFDYEQLIEMLCIVPKEQKGGIYWQLGVEENGVASCEALLLARHFMHKRVYQYSSVKAYSFHLARFMQKKYAREGNPWPLKEYLEWTDIEVLYDLRQSAKDKGALGYQEAEPFFDRSKRFKAIALDRGGEEEIDAFVNNCRCHLGAPPSSLVWEKSSLGKTATTFPVLRSSGKIVEAGGLLRENTRESNLWIYTAPEYEQALYRELETAGFIENVVKL